MLFVDRFHNSKDALLDKAGELQIQQEKEKMVKHEAVKEHLYGQHILQVPTMREPERFQFIPQKTSFAYPTCSIDKNTPTSRKYQQMEEPSVSIGTSNVRSVIEEDVVSATSAITFAESYQFMANPEIYGSLDEYPESNEQSSNMR